MKRYVLTGAPGSGKTAILRILELKKYFVVGEAATDVIAYEQAQSNQAPWENPDFIDKIVNLQKQRQMQLSKVQTDLQFYDRSPICTYALAVWLNFEPSKILLQEIEQIEKNQLYEKKVFFIENLGFCTPTEARKITFEDSLLFEKVHEDAYTKFGFECIKIPPALLLDRTEAILKHIK